MSTVTVQQTQQLGPELNGEPSHAELAYRSRRCGGGAAEGRRRGDPCPRRRRPDRKLRDPLVLPSGPGFISPEAYEAALSVDRPELQRRFSELFAHSGAEAVLFPTT